MSRFTADSLLTLREGEFGEICQYISEVHRKQKMNRMGKLVCKVIVGDIWEGTEEYTGTGFVLTGNFIMTSAHLFDECTDGDRLKKGTEVYVQFNYEDPKKKEPPLLKVEDALIYYIRDELDYAVLQVDPQALTQSGVQFPSGLLERVREMPENGEICIIGHPGGEVKQIDLTSIIEIEKRKKDVLEKIPQYNEELFRRLVKQLKKQGIERILMGGDRADKVLTYNTKMYHGASGSPVFDADGFLCGLHTGSFVFGPQRDRKHVIQYAYPMKNIIKHLVKKLSEPNQENLPQLLERMKDVAGKNAVLMEIFKINGSVQGTVALDSVLS